MDNKPRIGLDYDGCLAKTWSFVLNLVNYKHDTNYGVRDITSFPAHEAIPELTPQTYDFMDSTGISGQLPIMDHRIPRWLSSLESDYEIEIVTARSPKGATMARQWLHRRGMEYPVVQVPREKLHKKLELDYDILIDDAPIYYQQAGFYPDKQVIVHAAPWNKSNGGEPDNVIRLDGWDRIYNYLKVKQRL